jgi:hypothetical protein
VNASRRVAMIVLVGLAVGWGGSYWVVSGPGDVAAGHSQSYIAPGMPFHGSWGYRFGPNWATTECPSFNPSNDSSTVPPSHHRPAGGHFGVDYYACTGTVGRFSAYNWGSGTLYGQVGGKQGSCLDTND